MRGLAKRMMQTPAQRARAFTLTEVLVAVAAISVLTVAIAQIFQTVGSTVDTGRAVSRFNTVASRIERQMRDDIESMTRDGFLTIRHALVGSNGEDLLAGTQRDPAARPGFTGPDPLMWVQRSAEDNNPRPRRADEIVFFSTGSFTTARPPLVPGLTATSNNARIYYGHGVRQPSNLVNDRATTPTNERLPELNDDWVPFLNEDTEDYRLGGNGRAAPDSRGPNEYAGDWTLLRHVTLMAGEKPSDLIPLESQEALEAMGLSAANLNNAQPGRSFAKDRPFQVSGQPASTSIFASVGQLPLVRGSDDSSPQFYLRTYSPIGPRSLADNNFRTPRLINPLYASGLIDTTTEQLRQVMGVVNGAAIAGTPTLGFEGPNSLNNRNQLQLQRDDQRPTALRVFRSSLAPAVPADDTVLAERGTANMQAWMRDGFPTLDLPRSMAALSGLPTFDDWAARRRIRYEPGGPDVYFLLTEDNADGGFQARIQSEAELERNQRLADQSMLSSAIFAPGCSEFIVEWSFGEIADDFESSDAGEIIWHGLARVGADNDPETTPLGTNPVNRQNDYIVREYPFRRLEEDRAALAGFIAAHQIGPELDDVVSPDLIHGDPQQAADGNPNAGAGLFGADTGGSPPADWARPLYRANVYGLEGEGPNQADRVELYSYFGQRDVISLDDEATEWVWPKLIRVTVTLADPTDPLVEETFQFVFEVPDA